MENAEPAILLNTILMMATVALVQSYSQNDINLLFEIHKKDLAAQGFESKEIDVVTQQILSAITKFKEAENAES